MGGPELLRMAGVTKRFGGVQALDGVDIDVRAGEVHALLGENGAGKSTLVKILAGAERADAGSVAIDGEPLELARPVDALRAGIAMIYQELNLAPDLSVEQNVSLGVERSRWGLADRAAMRPAIQSALDALGVREFGPRTRVGRLGPGERQLVEIARALVANARIVAFDEPTSSLSHGDVERLFDVAGRLRERGVGVIWISHFLDEVMRVADRYTVLRDGRSVAHGAIAEASVDGLVEHMAGRRMEEFFPGRVHRSGDVRLRLRALRGPRTRGASDLELRSGEIFGVFGLVGAGRTEMLRACFGLDPLSGGEVTLDAAPAGPATPRARLRRGIGLLSEDRKQEGLATELSVAENLTLSRLEPVSTRGWISRRRRRAASAEWIERLGVRCSGPDQRVAELSGGNQQKVALGRLLYHDLDVLLLDEPTRGIDVGAKVEVYRLLGELAAQGKALVMVSSYLPELLGVCDRVAVMHRGMLGPARPVADWTEAEALDEATRGRA